MESPAGLWTSAVVRLAERRKIKHGLNAPQPYCSRLEVGEGASPRWGVTHVLTGDMRIALTCCQDTSAGP